MKNIYQIYHNTQIIPNYVKENIKKLNPDYRYYLINFETGKQIIDKYFDNELKLKIIKKIDTLPRYCHKSDLLRYCLLYMFGGVYLDVDLEPLMSFDKMNVNNVDFMTSFGRGGNPYIINNEKVYPITSNGFIISSKGNPILLNLINNIISNDKLIDSNPIYRGENVEFLYNYLNNMCIEKGIILEPYKKIDIDNNSIYLLNHVAYGNIDSFVNNRTQFIRANNPSYIFKRQTSGII